MTRLSSSDQARIRIYYGWKWDSTHWARTEHHAAVSRLAKLTYLFM
jgi:hypothetical protein